MSQANNASPEFNRLRWQCRRGMLELDEILMRYLEHQYPVVDSEQQQAFVELLAVEDPVLNRWLILGEKPDASLAVIVRAVRGREN